MKIHVDKKFPGKSLSMTVPLKMETRGQKKHQSKQTEVMSRLQSAGMKVLPGKKPPKNGKYSGIVGSETKKRSLNV